MDMATISPDEIVLWRWGFFAVNATILSTWLVMAILVGTSWLATRPLSESLHPSRWQSALEIVVGGIRDQIREISGEDPSRYVPFIGTLFVFIALSNVLTIVPGFLPPTGSLSTTTALAVSVFLAVPVYSIAKRGVKGYLRNYIQPTVIMLPFNVLGELTRTLALAVRLFGNIMSGTKIVAILLAIVPLVFPVVMQALGLLTGLIQAYIFSVLAMVYIASASRARASNERGDLQQHEM